MLRHGAFASDSGSHNQAIVGNHRLKEEHLNIYQILLYACGGWRTIPLVTLIYYLVMLCSRYTATGTYTVAVPGSNCTIN